RGRARTEPVPRAGTIVKRQSRTVCYARKRVVDVAVVQSKKAAIRPRRACSATVASHRKPRIQRCSGALCAIGALLSLTCKPVSGRVREDQIRRCPLPGTPNSGATTRSAYELV